MKVFVSYSHAQSDWVQDRLVPVLEAGGATVSVDYRHFAAGHSVIGQMNTWQDQAERHILVLSEQYVASDYCRHEMERAVAADPSATSGAVLAVRRADVAIPAALAPLIHVDLRDDTLMNRWKRLLEACGAELGTSAPEWLQARDDVRRLIGLGASVNLIAPEGIRWRRLINNVSSHFHNNLPIIDLEDPKVASRRGLLQAMLEHSGSRHKIPPPPEDLPYFGRTIKTLGLVRLALVRFDIARHRRSYNADFYAALRYWIMDERNLVLLIQSNSPFESFLPHDLPTSELSIRIVELRPHS